MNVVTRTLQHSFQTHSRIFGTCFFFYNLDQVAHRPFSLPNLGSMIQCPFLNHSRYYNVNNLNLANVTVGWGSVKYTDSLSLFTTFHASVFKYFFVNSELIQIHAYRRYTINCRYIKANLKYLMYWMYPCLASSSRNPAGFLISMFSKTIEVS